MTTIETNANPNTDPLRLPKKTRPPLLDFALPAVALSSGAMLGFAMTGVVNPDSFVDYAKTGLLAFSATAVSYGVNTLAIKHGAPQAASGYWASGLTSVLSMLMVGGGLWSATYSGLTLKDTAELQLQEHGQALGVYVAEVSHGAAGAGRADPVVRSIATDLDAKLACEIDTSCISGRGNGGNGTVARVVQEYAGRATSIAGQVATGSAVRGEIVSKMSDGLTAYRTTLGDEEKDIRERRGELQGIDARIRQSAGDLAEAVPLSLMSAYAAELQTGVSIPGREEAQARLNGILARHGQSLASVLGTIERNEIVPPAFPKRAGVSDTFGYIAHFLPIAAIAAVVELAFPLVLWLYSFWALDWGKYREQHARDARTAGDYPAIVMRPDEVPQPFHPELTRTGRNGHAPRGRDPQHPV